jgi:Tol biopolymer transport system component
MSDRPTNPEGSERRDEGLQGWKAIAAYLNRDVRTAKRWEATEGLPVHRHRHLARSTVYASPDELDAWRRNRRPVTATSPAKSRRLVTLAAVGIAALVTAGGGRADGPIRLVEAQGVVDTQVWSGGSFDLDGRPSPDGRFMPFPNYQASGNRGGNLAVRDMVGQQTRDLTNARDNSFAESPFFAADGRSIIFGWWDQPSDTWSVRTINPDGSGPRTIINGDVMRDAGATSPDGRTIAASFRNGGAYRIDLVDVASGRRTTLRSLDWREPHIGNFSPDGRYLVYSALTAQGQDGRDIFAIAIDGSSQVPLASAPAENRTPFFAPDGRSVVFASNRSGGRWDLWQLRMTEGKPEGVPRLLKTNVGPITLKGFGPDSTLFYTRNVDQHDAYEAELDPITKRMVGEPRRISDRFLGVSGAAKWSPDGSLLAYAVNRDSGGRYENGDVAVVIRDRTSGAEREVPVSGHGIAALGFFRWFPNNESILLVNYAPTGRSFKRLDLATGRMVTLFETPQSVLSAIVADHGQSVVYAITDVQDRTMKHLVRRRLDDGTETTILSTRTGGNGSAAFHGLTASPDGERFAYIGSGPKGGSSAVWVGSLRGGEPREVWRPEGGGLWPQHLVWSSDNKGVLVALNRKDQLREIWYVPADFGEAPHSTGIAMSEPVASSADPRGSRISFTTGHAISQLWTLKNILVAGATEN